jgi:hypothetical protein
MAGSMVTVKPLGAEMGCHRVRPSHTVSTETTGINMII